MLDRLKPRRKVPAGEAVGVGVGLWVGDGVGLGAVLGTGVGVGSGVGAGTTLISAASPEEVPPQPVSASADPIPSQCSSLRRLSRE